MVKTLPSADYLHACFDYDPESGELRWKQRPRSRFAGAIAGHIEKAGYRVVEIDHLTHKTHRVIWKWMTGEEAPSEIDHIDGNRANNRWNNLRLAIRPEQCWNRIKHKNNTSGYKGIFRHHGKWRAEIQVNGTRHILGRFDSEKEAAAAYATAAAQLHGKFYRER